MLRQFGVQGVKVQEIFSLDNEMLDFLPFVFHPEVHPLATELICVPVVLSTDSYFCLNGGKMTLRSKNQIALQTFGLPTR